MAKQKIAVIFGGNSSEHEISRLSAQNVMNNLDKDKYEVLPLGITRSGEWRLYSGDIDKVSSGEWEKNNVHGAFVSPDTAEGCIFVFRDNSVEKVSIDAAFVVLHGRNGEDGTIQGLLTMAGIPFTGCGVLSSALCMDKALAKQVFAQNNLPQADWLVFGKADLKNSGDIIETVTKRFSFPVFVKPSAVGSSFGAQRVDKPELLIKAIEGALEYDKKVLVEEYISAREIECGVLGNDIPIASPLSEIITSKQFYDFEAKYSEGFSSNNIPAALSKETADTIKELAKKAYIAADCRGFARVDFFVEKDTRRVLLNELNTIPGFTDKSAFPLMWKNAGISFSQLTDKIISYALEGQN